MQGRRVVGRCMSPVLLLAWAVTLLGGGCGQAAPDKVQLDPEQPLAQWETINRELALFDPELAEKPQIGRARNAPQPRHHEPVGTRRAAQRSAPERSSGSVAPPRMPTASPNRTKAVTVVLRAEPSVV